MIDAPKTHDPLNDKKRNRDNMENEPSERPAPDAMEEEESTTKNEETTSCGAKLNFSIQQGLSEDLTSLRANDRTARMLMEIECDNSNYARQIGTLLKGDRTDDDEDWARLDFGLHYGNGQPVEMQLQTKHADHIDVMEPSGANSTRRKISESKFAVDTRFKTKRVAGGARVFYPGMHLETTYTGAGVATELKFSTNVTSRQHDRQNFLWRVTLTASIGGKTFNTSADTNDFEYVARRLKQKPTARKKKVENVSRRKLEMHVEPSTSDSEIDADVHEPRIRRSTRKAAEVCRASLPKLMGHEDDAPLWRAAPSPAPNPMLAMANASASASVKQESGSLDILPDTHPGFHIGMDTGLPMSITPEMPRANTDDDLMRQPSSGGRNLCRVESIDVLFGNNTPRDMLNADLLDDIDWTDSAWDKGNSLSPCEKSTSLAYSNSSRSLRSLSRCKSDDDILSGLQIERSNSGLILTRCISSCCEFNLPASSAANEILMLQSADSPTHPSAQASSPLLQLA